jgi:hypothetical protein
VPDYDLASLAARVIWVVEDAGKSIGEYSHGFLEGYPCFARLADALRRSHSNRGLIEWRGF